MTENSQKNKPFTIESSDDYESNVKSDKVNIITQPLSSDTSSSISSNNLEEEYKKLNCNDENYYSNDCNKFLLKKELLERKTLLENEDDNQYLYPDLNDASFNLKIATKQEFNDNKYDGVIHENIKEHADALAKADFELQPHQAFVKNFLSFQTPYSSLLLYHGLGSGKTCSAIGVCEEMRDYMKQIGTTKRIIIVASENVQDNFKLQLFDERKLTLVDGLWNIKACTGNKLLKEINPMNMKGMSKDKVVSQIKNLINTYYIFLGYVQFANYIIKTMNYNEEVEKQKFKKDELRNKGEKSKIQMLKDVKIELNSRIIRRLRNEFDNRLIVIDEVHNIRKTDDNENKKVAINLELLVKSALNMRFLLLSATPMYNSYKEMVWLLNLMNTNDRRGRIEVKDIFKKNGDFKDDGEEVLTRKATGYISFVRGENPYTFPYRVYPKEFAKNHTFEAYKYPSYQMNLKPIKHEDKPEDVKSVLSLYLTKIGGCNNCGKCQYCAYKYIIYNLRNKTFSITTKTGIVRDMPSFENMESFGYTLLQTPLESLIISYPIHGLKSAIDEMPAEKISQEFAKSFAENNALENENENENEEAPGPIEYSSNITFSVKTPFSERKDSEEPEEVENPEKSKEIMKPKIKKLIIQHSDDDTNELLKINKDIIGPNVEKNDSDDDIEELQKEIIREEKKKLKNKNPLIIEDFEHDSDDHKNELLKINKDINGTKIEKNDSDDDTEELQKEMIMERERKLKNKNPLIIEESSSSNENSAKGGKGTSIDPHQLTGKIGLERMMNFIDEKSPPMKGEFEYKKSTLDNYKRIFSRKQIGNYSSKIKSILDNIANPDNGTVSEGIILIYSQYIDSGLIPMALSLEEMGFTRYGQNVKPLFKNKPTDVVDVRTMEPPKDNKKFMPARYAMITGDTRLSPNNDFEVKGLTGEDNKDGHKIKVVLISKAGSEGIDFKFIRQVHILEPWYNMNRIEQIIGRAVRNFSHKDLPFEKRNVEIFMYGTILGDNKEEAADLYVYRVAEYKAIQIGKVTRVLKETAVDCIINHGQTEFTQQKISDKLKEQLKEPIKQILSNGMVIPNFKIGDAPFSPACDYMAKCNYDCRPDKGLNIKDLNKDTYNENFIIINSEKILQRIRMLMKESYFYKQKVLLDSIRTPKEYPYVQIYSALTQLIEDENEFIVDKYGRNGRLINIGDYYLFQPLELRDKNASIFDRSRPIDYKHEMINFEIKQDIVKPVIDKRNLNNFIIEEDAIAFPEGNRLIDEMKVNFDISKDFTKQTIVPRGDDNWYRHCGIVMRKMSKDYPESKEYIIDYLVAHMMEVLLFEEKLEVMNYLYSMEHIKKGTFEWLAKEYYEVNSIKTRKFTAFIMYKLNKIMIMILNKDNKWIHAEPEEQRELFEYLNKLVKDNAKKTSKMPGVEQAEDILKFEIMHYNKIVGFIGYEKSNRFLAFKTKNMLSKRDTGARCDESGKVKTLQKLNEILGENKYTNENTKAEKDSDGNVIRQAIGNVELCVLQEFILRYFNTIRREDKKWFLTPEMAIWHKIYTIFA